MSSPRYRRNLAPYVWSTTQQAFFVVALTGTGCILAISLFHVAGIA